MKNFVQPGNIVTLIAPYTVSSGGGALVGAIFGVAVDDVASAVEGEFALEGVFDIAKATGAVTQGQKMYWDNAAKVVTTTATSNAQVGHATQAAGSGDATARVRLTATPAVGT